MKRVAALLAVVLVLVAAPSAAFAADSSYRSLTAASHPDWMGALPSSLSLAALSVPGTHETLSIHGGALTQTQEDHGDDGATLTAQLTAGIRMIDIRARIEADGTFAIYHGLVRQNATFDDVLGKLESFLAAHPGETVLMRLKQECTAELGSCTDASGQRSFADIVDTYVAARPGLFWSPSVTRAAAAATPELGSVRGRVVVTVVNGPRGGVVGHYGLAQFGGANEAYVQDEYTVPNIGAIATKRDQVRRFLDATSAGDPAMIYVNFGSGSSLFCQPQQTAGGAFGVQGVNPFLLTYLNQGPEVHAPVLRTGVLMLDFPGGGLIDKILSIN